VDDSAVRAVLAGAFSHGPGKTLPLAAPPPPRPLIAGGVPLCALADGPFGVAVVRALRLALAPQRFEPWNAYNDHRAYPSPRAAFVVDVAVRAGAGRWHLDPVRERLFGPGDPPPPTVAVTLELTADPGRLPATYRSLAEALAYLEAGHVAAALVEAAATQGLAAECSTVDGVTTVSLTAGRTAYARPPAAISRSAGIAPRGLTADPRPLPAATLPALLRAGTDPPPGSPARRPGLRHAAAVRGVTGHPDGIYEAGPVLAGPVLAGPVLAGPVLAGPVLTGPVLAGPVLTADGDVMPGVQEAFTYPPRSIATAGMNVAWVMTAAVADAVRADGPAAYHELLVAAGAAAQHIGTAAAELGLFCRPCRSVREAPLEALVSAPAAHDLLYLLLIGRSRVRDFAYDLTRPDIRP